MDLLRLNSSSFYPDKLIEGYSSLIWTERYAPAGEFQLITYDIARTMTNIPKGSLITHRRTREVMIVESHSVTIDADGNKMLTTKGRTLESFLEQRVIRHTSDKTFGMEKDYTSVGAAEVLLWNAFVNTEIVDVVVGDLNHDPLDAIPNLSISESTQPGYDSKTWWLEPDYVYNKFLVVLSHDNLGVRCARPVGNPPDYDPTEVTIVSVDSDDGSIIRTDTPNVKDLLINIYDGTDRSVEQFDTPPIVFSYQQGHLDNPEYLYTIQNKKNIGYWTSKLENETYYYDEGAETAVGLDRRYLLVDFGSDLASDPIDFVDAEASSRQKITNRVKRSRREFYFTATSSDGLPYNYKTDYNLGDKITLIAEYGTNTTAVVSEYVLTEDETGEQGYPTLVIDT